MTGRKITRAGLIRKVDAAFSRYIRKRDAQHDGSVQCVTCKTSLPWQEMQAGHFVKRGHAATRWDERNVAPQCCRCNLYLGGAQDEFSAHIVRTLGAWTLEDLMRLKRTTKRYTMDELRTLLDHYGEH